MVRTWNHLYSYGPKGAVLWCGWFPFPRIQHRPILQNTTLIGTKDLDFAMFAFQALITAGADLSMLTFFALLASGLNFVVSASRNETTLLTRASYSTMFTDAAPSAVLQRNQNNECG